MLKVLLTNLKHVHVNWVPQMAARLPPAPLRAATAYLPLRAVVKPMRPVARLSAPLQLAAAGKKTIFSSTANIQTSIADFHIEGHTFRYSSFVSRLRSWCRSLGFDDDKTLASRAVCSDENQGFPIILLAREFGGFPFDHGLVGGVIATDRHGPHAAHAKDALIVHVSHSSSGRDMVLWSRQRSAASLHTC